MNGYLLPNIDNYVLKSKVKEEKEEEKEPIFIFQIDCTIYLAGWHG